jgi:putative endonuclease
MYYVYILASGRHGTLYQHRNGEGSFFVKKYGVYRLVYVEAYDRADEAIVRETTKALEAGLEDRADRTRES